jgi:hypothetical protein
MSQTSENPETGGDNLRRALATLPAHEPDPDTWGRLAAQLTADAALARALPSLPTHAPDEELWATIAARLDTAAAAPGPAPILPAVRRRLWPARTVRQVLALAASLLLVLGIGWQLLPRAPKPAVAHETVTFSEEAGALSLPSVVADPLEQQGLSFIDSRCSTQPAVCQSGEFRTLRTQLQELETQQAQLQQAARRFGPSPEVLREQARLVTLKAAFTRQLVQLLLS